MAGKSRDLVRDEDREKKLLSPVEALDWFQQGRGIRRFSNMIDSSRTRN
jgi:hypothetical protein